METKLLVVYPRGFIGVATPGLNKETNNKSATEKILDLRYNKHSQSEVPEVYNINISKIHNTLTEGIMTKDKLTFNKAVLVEAIRNFGSLDITDFINNQKKSRYFGLVHQNFIIDTLKFIRTGRRDTSLRTWEIALKKKNIDNTEHYSTNKEFEKSVQMFLSALASDGKPITYDLLRILPEWLSHRNGNEDLLLTLNLLFGRPKD